MNAGEFLFVAVMFMAIQRFAMIAANAAAEGRSWMEALAVASKDQIGWLAVL
jgi:hypothetical protein